MHWYRIAKQMIKEALRATDLYDFYLISSLYKDDMYQEFKRNPEAMYYLVDKLEKLKAKYIKDGVDAVNGELYHASSHIYGPEELSEAINTFNTAYWDPGYGSEAWGDVATSLNNIYRYPSLYDTLNSNNINFIVDAIYDLIFLIDHFNDVCHNNGRALHNMMTDLNETQLGDFLDYKKDAYDLKPLMHMYSVDPELVDMFKGVKGEQDLVKIDPNIALIYARRLQEGNALDVVTMRKLQDSLIEAVNDNPVVINIARIVSFAEEIQGADIPKIQSLITHYQHINYLIEFVKKVEGADVSHAEQAVIEDGSLSNIYNFARNVPGANIPVLEQAFLDYYFAKDGPMQMPSWISTFAANVKGVNISRFQELAIDTKDAVTISGFAIQVDGADIPRLQAALLETKNYEVITNFVRYVKDDSSKFALVDLKVIQDVLLQSNQPEYLYRFIVNTISTIDREDLKAIYHAVVDMVGTWTNTWLSNMVYFLRDKGYGDIVEEELSDDKRGEPNDTKI